MHKALYILSRTHGGDKSNYRFNSVSPDRQSHVEFYSVPCTGVAVNLVEVFIKHQ